MQYVEWEPVIAAPCHFVPSDEEGAHALADVEVDAAECRSTRPVAEVVRPAAQTPVQALSGDSFNDHSTAPRCLVRRRPPHHFRGLLRLYACYGPSDRSATQGDLCHEAPALPVAQPSCSSASGPIDKYPGGTLLH